VPPRQKANGRYRGRRRVQKLPSTRYAAVVTTAVVGAGVVALAAGAAVPDGASGNALDPTKLALSVMDRQAALDKAARSQDRPGPAVTVEQERPDFWLLPVKVEYQITTLWEMRWGEFHRGVDMAAPYGTPYYAAHGGTVILAAYYGGYGNCVIVDHGGGVITVYGHASRLLVAEGQRVETGQALGLIGSTGYSTGSHLHFEVRVNNEQVDPMNWMRAHGVDIAKRLEEANGGIIIR
jgi:murein DD-endopeptidase MepM/ murein hydrolase activator NlpD